ncbi:MAG: hypothetical protein PHU92_00595 [Candidatus Shapirobacteria bacterium]|nr:hypothetical protein [Candidatus Shapirobacteria bacterium]
MFDIRYLPKSFFLVFLLLFFLFFLFPSSVLADCCCDSGGFRMGDYCYGFTCDQCDHSGPGCCGGTNDCSMSHYQCICACPPENGGSDPDPDPDPRYRIVGRVTKDNVLQNYSTYSGKITSEDGKTCRELDSTGYYIGTWSSCNREVVINMNTSWAPGYTCRWSFDDINGTNNDRSGNDCSAEVKIGCGDENWQNHLWFHLSPSAPPPTCAVSGNLSVSVGEEATFCVDAENADEGSEIWYALLGSELPDRETWTNIRPKTVGDGCGTVTFSQPGQYHVNCNAYSSSAGACTGNPGCPWGTHPYPGFTCAGWSDCTSNDSMVVTVTAPNAWYQTQGGNVYGQAVTTSIPSVAANRYFSLSSSWADSGLVSSSSKEPEPSDFSGAQVSQTDADWRAQGDLSTIANRYTYQYFASLLDINEANEEVSFRQEEVLANPGSLEENIIVYSGDNMTIGNPYWVINNQKIITFIDGDLTINEPISIVGNGFLALIVNGNLTVDIGTTPESTSPVLQGVYIVNGAVIIPERETEPKFVGEGIFFARGGFSLEKDLGDANAFYPAELFIFNPRYLFTAPKMIRYAPQLWQELAP